MNAPTYADAPATAAYTLTARQVTWLRDEAKRRGLSASALLRLVVEHAMQQEEAVA